MTFVFDIAKVPHLPLSSSPYPFRVYFHVELSLQDFSKWNQRLSPHEYTKWYNSQKWFCCRQHFFVCIKIILGRKYILILILGTLNRTFWSWNWYKIVILGFRVCFFNNCIEKNQNKTHFEGGSSSHTSLRDGSRYQIGWIFGKISNSLSPPCPHFRKILQSVFCFDFSQYNCWKHIPWPLKLLFCINFTIKKPCLKFPKFAT